MPEHEIGVVGLATMGQNLARNLASRGVRVAVYNRTHQRTEDFMAAHSHEGDFRPAASLEELARILKPPRAILLMVKAGSAVDEAIDSLSPVLAPGDTIIDGGNSLFLDTRRRAAAMEAAGLGFIGAGVSGGEEGALLGPSIMPGGTRESYARVAEMLTAIAAKVDGVPCCTYIGPDGAGLIEITANVLAKRDGDTQSALVDAIEDKAEQKGTGRWTSESALELGVPLTGITEAVFARMLSSQKAERVKAASTLAGPGSSAGSAARLVDDARDALYASKIVAYAQGFEHLRAGSKEFGWNLDLGALATIWRGGCIIRAQFLDRIKDAYAESPDLPNLMLAPFFQQALASAQKSWRSVVKKAIDQGVPIPAFASSLAYYDGYRRARGPANLIQGLRDYFGAHTYHRVDREGSFHTRWAQDGTEVRVD